MNLEGKQQKSTNNINNKKIISISKKLVSNREISGECNFKNKNKSLFKNISKSKDHSKSIISKNDLSLNNPTLVEFRNYNIEKYVIIKSNNTSYSNIINNNASSFIDDYRSSRLGDSMLKMRDSFLNNNNNSFSKESKRLRKNILYSHFNENEKSSDNLRSSVVYNLNQTDENNINNNSKDQPQIHSNKVNFHRKLNKLATYSNDYQSLSNNYSQLRESFKASIVSLALNNNLNTSNINLDLSQSQILLPNQKEFPNNMYQGNSTPRNNLFMQRNNSDVTISINPIQNKFKRFTNYYSAQKKKEKDVEIVNNVCEFSYLKMNDKDLDCKKCDDNDYELENTDEFVQENVNKVKVIDVKQNSLNNENIMINFHKILRKFHRNEPMLEILEHKLKSTSIKLTELNKLEKLYQELNDQLEKSKRSLKTDRIDDIDHEIDLELLDKEIVHYQSIFNDKCRIYQGIINQLSAILNSNKENIITNEIESKNNCTSPNICSTKNNNYMGEIKSINQNTQDRSNDNENQSIIDLVLGFKKIDINNLTYEIPLNYIDLINKMTLIESNYQGDNKINKYSNQIVEKIYQNKTIKRSFNDGYDLYLYENGDIKQVFPDKTKVYFYFKNKACEYNYETTLGYKIIVFDKNNYSQIYLDGTKISKRSNSNQLKIKRKNEIIYY